MEYSEAEKQMLREVLPGIAVQLRGALANIHGALGRLAPERLRDRDTGTDRSAAILCQSYYKILRVVNNLSDAPMLAEDKPLDTENVELVELLEGLCRQGQVLAELLDLRLVFTCRDRAHVIAANRELLERLFWNLVSNAMKFTPPGGTIEVALRTGPDCVLLCVKDSGPGIPQDKLERLFDRCTVIAALRKDHTPLLDRLRSRPDVFVWDLDLHQHPCQVGCVVMASGWSRRFSGENKLLLPVDGKPMIRHTLEKLAALSLERVTVVSRYEPVRAMAAEYGFQALDNPLMLQSDTIRLGLAEMAEMDGCMLCVADQPYCTRESMEALLRLFRENPDRICRLSFRGQPGNPAIFPRVLFAEISALTGDTGAREVIRRYPDRVLMLETADAEELHDIDRPEDLPGTSPAE